MTPEQVRQGQEAGIALLADEVRKVVLRTEASSVRLNALMHALGVELGLTAHNQIELTHLIAMMTSATADTARRQFAAVVAVRRGSGS